MLPNVGDRIQMTGVMPNDPDPIPVGTTGTVVDVSQPIAGRRQIDVEWDIDRSLYLLDSDPFRIISRAEGSS